METNKLSCGCVVEEESIRTFCKTHTDEQPTLGDPLDIFLNLKYLPIANAESKLETFFEFDFFNDGKKPVQLRLTTRSVKDNPESIGVQELKTIKIRPGGFVKLWDYENHYQLLVE